MFPSEYQGFAVAVFNMFGSTAGALATLILSWMKQNFDGQKDDPAASDIDQARVDGVILGWTVIISYLICGPLFIISGIKFGKNISLQKSTLIASSMADQNDQRNGETSRSSVNEGK